MTIAVPLYLYMLCDDYSCTCICICYMMTIAVPLYLYMLCDDLAVPVFVYAM